MVGYPLAAASRRGLSRMVLGVRFHEIEYGMQILMVEMLAGDGIQFTRSVVTRP